eukprot:scaffold315353_cov45-Tisochrysis_lutea.AAC.2
MDTWPDPDLLFCCERLFSLFRALRWAPLVSLRKQLIYIRNCVGGSGVQARALRWRPSSSRLSRCSEGSFSG